jgi:hypothetical protein
MVPAELMVRAVTVPADTVPQADDLLHQLVASERFEIVVHRRHASSLEGSGTENKVSGHSRRERDIDTIDSEPRLVAAFAVRLRSGVGRCRR